MPETALLPTDSGVVLYRAQLVTRPHKSEEAVAGDAGDDVSSTAPPLPPATAAAADGSDGSGSSSGRDSGAGGGRAGHTRASKRLMKELQRIHKSEALASMVRLPIELADGDANLFEWSVRLRVDAQCSLGKDLTALTMATDGEVDSILLRISFPDDYPFAPPFFRVAAPYVTGGFVQRGGALCTELLTQQGWAQSYTMEAVLMQVASILAHPRTHIAEKAPARYTEEAARRSHRLVVLYHAQHGWGSPPPELG